MTRRTSLSLTFGYENVVRTLNQVPNNAPQIQFSGSQL